VNSVEKEYIIHDGNLLVKPFLSRGLNNLIANARGANLLLLEGFVGTHYELTIDPILYPKSKRLVFHYNYITFEWCPY
jgi:hypothetical protein